MRISVVALVLVLMVGAAPTTALAAAKVSSSDREFLNRAAQSYSAEIMEAQLARRRAVRADVRNFAQRILREDRDAATRLKRIASDADIAWPKPMRAAKSMLAVKPLRKFDLAYIGAERAALRDEVEFYRQEKAYGAYPPLRQFAAQMLPIVERQYDTVKQLPGNATPLPAK